jgi:hypothetical protein
VKTPGGVPWGAPGPEHPARQGPVDPIGLFSKEKIMAKVRIVLSTIVGAWEQLLVAMLANAGQFLHVEEQRNRLQQLLERARQLATEQDAHTAAKQAASKEMEVVLADGKKLATFLRNAVTERYGNRNEKLVEFGLQPFRRRRREPSETEVPGTNEPSAPAPATPVKV